MEALEDKVLVDRRGADLWLTLNRPDKANAMTVGMLERTTAAIVAAGTDPNVKAVLLTGAGERVFCAGVDVREKPADGNMAHHRERRSHALARLQDSIIDVPRPVIAVLNGTASGGGAMLALLADVCVAVDTAELAMPEIDVGIATFSGANILAVVGGRALALDLIQSGRRMLAPEAFGRGLVRQVYPRSDLHAGAAAIAGLLAAKNQQIFADNKRWINRAMKAALTEAREAHARHRAGAAK